MELLEKMGQSIQEWTKQDLWKTVFKKFEGMWSASAEPVVRKLLAFFGKNVIIDVSQGLAVLVFALPY